MVNYCYYYYFQTSLNWPIIFPKFGPANIHFWKMIRLCKRYYVYYFGLGLRPKSKWPYW